MILRYWRKFQSLADIKSGAALGLLTLALAYSMFRGHDIGMGSATAYAAAVTGFTATKIKGKANDN